MDLTKEEFRVLWQLEEGSNFIEEIEQFTEIPEDKIKKILIKFKEIGLIKINKKYDEHYKKENWFSTLEREKSKPLYEKYKGWIPKGA